MLNSPGAKARLPADTCRMLGVGHLTGLADEME
jgi:hypothetical protein